MTKWYIDAVTEEGDVAIAYWADLRWGPLHQTISGIFAGPRGRTQWRFSGRRVAEPIVGPNGLRWTSDPLGVSVELEPLAQPFDHQLLDVPQGVIDWRCELPRAAARLSTADGVLEGLGYAERLDMTVLPWQIPADEIRWGRFMAGDVSVVWIEWRGESPRRLVFHNGRLLSAESISETEVRFAGGLELNLRDSAVITEDVIGRLIAPFESIARVFEPVMRTEQTRWVSRGELRGPGVEPVRGWAIHEIVRRK